MRLLIALLAFLALSAFASAYIDPGTGGLIIGSIGPIIAAIIGAIVAFITLKFIKPVRKLLAGLWEGIKGFLVSNKIGVIVIVFLLIVAVALAGIVLGEGQTEKRGKKVLLIGIDAFEPKIVEKLWQEGKMQNFRKLSEQGSFSRLETTIPPETPVAWSAAATGMNPAAFGIFDFIKRDAETYLPKLNLAVEKQGIFGTEYESAMKGKPFWQITSEKGIPTTVIRWPVTFPPEKVEGRMLSGLGVVDVRGLLSGYSYYSSENEEAAKGDSGRTIKVDFSGRETSTYIAGPRKIENGKVVDVNAQMKIKREGKKFLLSVNGKDYGAEEGKWSGWIEVKFSAGFMQEVWGEFKVYIISSEPFEMYMTTMQFNPKKPYKSITYPEEYSKELADEIGLYYTLGMPEETKGVTENKLPKEALYEQIKEIEAEREKMFWAEFRNFNKGVFAFGFDSGDRLQHIFWENKVLDENDEYSVPKEIEDYYLGKDKFLGKLMEKVDYSTSLIIFSDHGFSSFEKEVSLNTWLYKNGYVALTKEINAEDEGALFKYVDWEKTRAYSLGFNSIYINMKGREGKGIVEKGGRNALIDEIVEKLKKWKDQQNGKNVMKEVYRADEIYSGKFMDEAPDIITGTNEGYRLSWQNAVGGFTEAEIFENSGGWKGEHLIDRSFVPALIFTNFKAAKNPGIIDIAPTVLDALGIEVPKSMEGKSLLR